MGEHDAIKAKLKDRREELTTEMKEIDERLREPETRDDEDRATEREDDEVLEGLGTSAEAELHAIDEALTRFDLGTFGTCTHCGEPVAQDRLEAIPHAAHCIRCASHD